MAFTRTWNENDPLTSDEAKYGAQEIRELKVDVRERMTVEHDWSTGTTDPAGMHKWSVTTTSSSITLNGNHHIVLATANTALTLTLPTAVGLTGKPYIIKKVGGGNTVTIATTGSETIDGSSSVVITEINDVVSIVSDGSNWYRVQPYVTTHPAFKATKTGGDQSVSPSTWVKVTFDGEEFDTNNNFDLTTERFTPTVPGKYLLVGNVVYHNLANDYIAAAAIYKNGSIHKEASTAGATTGGGGICVTAIVDANGV